MSVAALKLVCLLLNLRDTFKALKKPSRRRLVVDAASNGGPEGESKAVVRMSSARRERLRETLMIWVVWTAWVYTEQVLDWSIGWILPFYTQFKLLFLIYLITTRSFGAYGLYQHVLKPVIDIYSSPIDLTLLLLKHTGALIVHVLVTAPLHIVHDNIIPYFRPHKPQPPADTNFEELKQSLKNQQAKVGVKAKELRDLRATGMVRKRSKALEKAAAALAPPTPVAPGGFRVYPSVPSSNAPLGPSRPLPLPKFPALPPTLHDFNEEMDKRETLEKSVPTTLAQPKPIGKLRLVPKASAEPPRSKPAPSKTQSARVAPLKSAPSRTSKPGSAPTAAPAKAARKRKALEEPLAESAPAKVLVKRTVGPKKPAGRAPTVATPAKKRKLNDGDAEYIDVEAVPARAPRRKAAIAAEEALATPKPRAKRKSRA